MSVFQDSPELLVQFRAGQRDALERVYRAYVRSVDRYLRWMAKTTGHQAFSQSSAIADLLQEVFVRAFSPEARGAYDGLRDYAPYLAAIARNCFIDTLRARQRELPISPRDLEIELDSAATTIEDFCEPEVLAVLNVYLAELPRAWQEVYQQRFVLGRSQEEASAALGITRRAIRTAEGHLRRGLRQALARAGISLRETSARPAVFSTRNPPGVVTKART